MISASTFVPDWPAPARVHALQTTRQGGMSRAPYASFNLGTHVGDAAAAVAENRRQLASMLPGEPLWLEQVHGCAVVLAEQAAGTPRADAAVTRRAGKVCAVMTADCLPLLLCDAAGSVVAAAHAGWRGLADGVIEATLRAMQVDAAQAMAWLGPAIGPQAFEVGGEVREQFVAQQAQAAKAFVPTTPGKWRADLYQLARLRLQAAGVQQISGGKLCTHGDAERFFSYRRDGQTGRMATLIWLED